MCGNVSPGMVASAVAAMWLYGRPKDNRFMRTCFFQLARALAALPLLAMTAADAAPTTDLTERLAACTACHGKEGRTINAEYLPRIAGKPGDTSITSCSTSATGGAATRRWGT